MNRFTWTCLALSALAFPAAADTYRVGVAQVDITPSYPVRLSGFGFRRTESEGVTQRIWAKALVIDDGSPAVLLTVDNLGVPWSLTQELARRLAGAGVRPERLAVTATHTHTAPMLTNVAPTLFSQPIPKDHQERIDRYTAELTDKLEQVARAALQDRKPARLSWGIGSVGFAVNRRTRGGPVDHDLPVLVVRDLRNQVRAIYVTYACHCVTLSNNKISGDWAGYAQQAIQDAVPGALALVSIGCGADANPSSGVSGDKVELALRQGLEIAAEVQRLLGGYLAPVTGQLTTVLQALDLPLAPPPSREHWQAKAQRQDAVGYHARVHLARLDRGEPLKSKIVYPIQSWLFGQTLAMVFLPGEVVVDYALRLKKELDRQRLWITAYSNDAPCYIPSERILQEGGYEGGGAMVYYDLPGPLAPGLEEKIVSVIHAQLGNRFQPPYDPQRVRTAQPLSPQQSLAALRTKANLTVELMAAEPLVIDPVAIDFGPDGKLWVAEMHDYPAGTKGDFQPGGRIRVVQDTDGDGRFDQATVFLDNIPFPTGVTVWREGVLVCAAPDILYAEDTDGDGKADVVRKLYTGFGAHNYQARVNSLQYGLDGWVYGSCGSFGGTIQSFNGKTFPLGDRDFRIKPDTGELEPTTGRTQQGKARDDWGNWFGCDNTTLCIHYPLDDHYLRRNPQVAHADTSVYVPDYPNSHRLFPAKPSLQLFPLSGETGTVTAACGLGIYRDDLLGPDFRGNVFVCEPVNLIVHRLQLTRRGSTFRGQRPADEQQTEFLSSTDNWFRPVQVRTGPDGCLWVVDMYRYVIEHPQWIPPEELVKLDVRAGSTMGRLYRIRPKDHEPRPWPRLDKLDAAGLVAALDSPNGWQRDLATQLLLWRKNAPAAASFGETVRQLERLATAGSRPETRLHALCLVAELAPDATRPLIDSLTAEHPGLRRHAIRLLEKLPDRLPALVSRLAPLQRDPDAQVRLQLAYTLGQSPDAQAARLLADLALNHADDPHLTAAVLSSLNRQNMDAVLTAVLAAAGHKEVPAALVQPVLATASALAEEQALADLLRRLTEPRPGARASWQLTALAGFLDGLERRGKSLEEVAGGRTVPALEHARSIVADEKAAEKDRLAAVRVLGYERVHGDADLQLLARLLTPQAPASLQTAAVLALGRWRDARAADLLLAGWRSYSPGLKSQALDLFLSRDVWQQRLLSAVENNEVPAGDLDAIRRQRLLNHRDAALRGRAARLFVDQTDRQRVVDEYLDVLSKPGDRGRGKAVFARVCSSCHWMHGVGHEVGPSLWALTNNSPQYLLTAILHPNKDVDARYTDYLAITRSGRTFNGRLTSETATSITLAGQEGRTVTLLRTELEELQSTGKSLMPEGLERDLSRQDLADLIAYLVASGPSFKKFLGNHPALVQPVNGRLTLSAAAGAIYGGDIAFEQAFQNIGYWHGPDDRVVWEVQVDQPGRFDVWLDWACEDAVAGNAFVLEGTQPPLRGKVAGTGGWDRYRREKIGTVALDAGLLRLTLRPDGGRVRGALMDLRAVVFVPEGQPLEPAPAQDFDAVQVAREILDDSKPDRPRQKLAAQHADRAAELITALTADLKPGTKEEYRRIPWIWRVAVAAGKRNDADVLRRLLAVSLPKLGEPLLDWQAVVLGGGVINGISLQGVWPGPRLDEILKGDADLTARWKQALTQASAMADNAQTPTGTRYDALRMIALDDWQKRGAQLTRYLAKGTHDELQMGAVSGLSDVDVPQVADLLLGSLDYLNAENRALAVAALLRTEERVKALLQAWEQGRVQGGWLTEEHRQALRNLKNNELRERALKLLKP